MLHSANNRFMGLLMTFTAMFFLLGVNIQAQDLVLNGNVNNDGTINVNRHVINNTAGSVSVTSTGGTGRVHLTGAANAVGHSIGGGTGISFFRLDARGARETRLETNVTVTDRLGIGFTAAFTAGDSGFTIKDKTLSLGNTSSYSAASTAALTFAGGTVNYTHATAQTVLVSPTGITYGTLGLTGNAAMTIPDAAAGNVSVGTLTHSGSGTVTANDSVSITVTGSIGTLADVASNKLLNFAGTSGSSITAVTTATGTIRNSVAQALSITTMNGNAGVVENTNSGTLTVATLNDNDGTIRNTSASGTVAFTNAASNGNGTITASAGTVDFNDNVVDGGTGNTLSLTGTGTMKFAGSVANDNYSFASGTTAEFDGGAQAIPAATFGNLIASGSADKSLGGNIIVADNLTLTNDITTGANVLQMTSTTAANISGSGEVIGAVRRNHNFTLGQNYVFNRANVYMNFESSAAGDLTLSMTPATNPTSFPTAKYMQRQYSLAVGTNPGNVDAIQLYYNDGTEEQGGANESRLGLRQRIGGNWSKLFSTGYTRSSGTGLVTISSLSGVSLASVTELAMSQVSLVAVASTDWATASTWDENLAPVAGDDVEVPTAFNITVGSGAQAGASVDLQGTSTLTVSGGSLALSDYLNIPTGGGLTLSGGSLTATDSVVNAGDISVSSGQSLATAMLRNNSGANTVTFTGDLTSDTLYNDGGTMTFNGSSTTIADMVTNASGASLIYGGTGTLNLMNSAAATLTSAGNISVNTSGGIITVGASGIPSALAMTGSSTLTLASGTFLNVYGDLNIGASVTVVNDGEITVGE